MHQALRPGAMCVSASRQANPAPCGGGLLSVTSICQETFEVRVWLTARAAFLAAGGGTQAGTGDGGLHNDRPGRSGQQRNSRGAEQEPVAGW